MNLPKRLLCCAEQVRPGAKFVDVGTDHALLPCYLVQQGQVAQAIAADVNEKPLMAARQTIAKQQCTDKVHTRLSDGLAQIAPGEATDIVIAGMGGELILRIVTDCDWVKHPDKRLILQPMTQMDTLRLGLCAAGFAIEDEVAVSEKGHDYTILRCVYRGEARTLTPLEAVGGCHLQHPTGDSARYLRTQLGRLQKIAAGLGAAGAADAAPVQALVDKLAQWMEEHR